MAAPVMIPLEEYLNTSYEYDCEWVDGELKQRALPDDDHSALQTYFVGYFSSKQRELQVRVRPSLRLRVAARRYRVPDVLLMPASVPRQPIPYTPPILCIEILSNDDRPGELKRKIADYLAMGVHAIWIVDPRRRELSVADAAGLHLVDRFAVPHSDRVLTPAEIFAELDSL